MTIDIKILLEKSLEDFTKSSMNPFDQLPKISMVEKKKNEREARKLIDRFYVQLLPFLKKPSFRVKNEDIEPLHSVFLDFAAEADKKNIFFDGPFFQYFLDHGYLKSSEDFFHLVKDQDPEMLAMDFFQALRNIFISNSLQLLFGKNVELTKGMAGYSLLYPYTDNYIDDPKVSSRDKKDFNKRFQNRLEGKDCVPLSLWERKVYGAIEAIETTLPRSDHPLVYESLLLIHDAQVLSLSQNGSSRLSPHIILPISFYKGGASVVADACLVNPTLSQDMVHFSFNYGTFLQLIDDLQDSEEDREHNHWTLFSLKNQEEIHDLEISKLISYMVRSLHMFTFNTPEEESLKKIIFDACLMMIMSVVGKNPNLVSIKLYKALEDISRFKLSFYDELEEKMELLVQSDWTKTTLEDLNWV